MQREMTYEWRAGGQNPHWRFRVEICAVALSLLSGEADAEKGAALLRASVFDGRDQRQLLFIAKADELLALARGNPK